MQSLFSTYLYREHFCPVQKKAEKEKKNWHNLIMVRIWYQPPSPTPTIITCMRASFQIPERLLHPHTEKRRKKIQLLIYLSNVFFLTSHFWQILEGHFPINEEWICGLGCVLITIFLRPLPNLRNSSHD